MLSDCGIGGGGGKDNGVIGDTNGGCMSNSGGNYGVILWQMWCWWRLWRWGSWQGEK